MPHNWKITKKTRQRIPQETKVRAQLQQEINSVCPFCDNREVGHFHIHHIDENPQNNLNSNLILVCPICHSKITKRDITQAEVVQVKKQLPNLRIEVVAVGIDSKNCSWTSYDDIPNAFLDHESKKSPFPILNFSLINHSKETILLTAIHIGVKHVPSWLSAIPSPSVLKSAIKYKFPIPNDKTGETHQLEDQLEVPAEQAFKFQIELFSDGNNELYEIRGRKVLYFTFNFGKYSIKAPDVFLNCKTGDETVRLVVYG